MLKMVAMELHDLIHWLILKCLENIILGCIPQENYGISTEWKGQPWKYKPGIDQA